MIEPVPPVLFTADELAITTRGHAFSAELAAKGMNEPRIPSPRLAAMTAEREQLLAPYGRRDHLEKVISGSVVPGFLSPDERATWDRRISELRDIYNQACARLGTPELPH